VSTATPGGESEAGERQHRLGVRPGRQLQHPTLVLVDDVEIARSVHRHTGGVLEADDYLDMVAARARPNTVLASAFDLKVFFSVVGKEPAEIGHADVLAFIQAQRATATRGDGGADRGRRGGPVRAHHQASTGLGHRATTT
jgi:hypothetical protein